MHNDESCVSDFSNEVGLAWVTDLDGQQLSDACSPLVQEWPIAYLFTSDICIERPGALPRVVDGPSPLEPSREGRHP